MPVDSVDRDREDESRVQLWFPEVDFLNHHHDPNGCELSEPFLYHGVEREFHQVVLVIMCLNRNLLDQRESTGHNQWRSTMSDRLCWATFGGCQRPRGQPLFGRWVSEPLNSLPCRLRELSEILAALRTVQWTPRDLVGRRLSIHPDKHLWYLEGLGWAEGFEPSFSRATTWRLRPDLATPTKNHVDSSIFGVVGQVLMWLCAYFECKQLTMCNLLFWISVIRSYAFIKTAILSTKLRWQLVLD